MDKFPHLNFIQKITGKPIIPGGGGTNPTTASNKENRSSHSSDLTRQTTSIKNDWQNAYFEREKKGLAKIDEEIIPVFFQVEPEKVNYKFDLTSFGIEIISEEKDGFIIGASLDNLKTLQDKIDGFPKETHNTGRVGELWKIVDGDRELWKAEYILSPELLEKWSSIEETSLYKLEISIAFGESMPKEPDSTKDGYERRLKKYRKVLEQRDDNLLKRQDDFEEFINVYGTITSPLIELSDCFGCEVEINGKGLKDLVINYPFVFEVTEVSPIYGVGGEVFEGENNNLEILPPEENSPVIGVIDSGIMEGHALLHLAIDKENSISLVENEESVADFVQNGGHGTRVTSAILYPNGISHLDTPYTLPCFIRNIRVLDKYNELIGYPPMLMQEIVDNNSDCKVFNLSITENKAHERKHMSNWAAKIDEISNRNGILFVISTGNIPRDIIQDYISSGKGYPEYLKEKDVQIASPSQSSFSLAVGSINQTDLDNQNWKSLGGKIIFLLFLG